MTILETIKTRRSRLGDDLSQVRQAIAASKRQLTQAIVDGKDIDQITNSLTELERRQASLEAAMSASEQAMSDQAAKATEAECVKAASQVRALVDQVDAAGVELLTSMIALADQARQVADKFNQIQALVARYDISDRVSTYASRIPGTFAGKLSYLLAAYRRQSEIAFLPLFDKAGIKRKFGA